MKLYLVAFALCKHAYNQATNLSNNKYILAKYAAMLIPHHVGVGQVNKAVGINCLKTAANCWKSPKTVARFSVKVFPSSDCWTEKLDERVCKAQNI